MITTTCERRSELPVGKIVAVGRNYADHAAEMGASRPAEPILFLKPSTSLVLGGGSIGLPEWSSDVHHEVEMVVRVGRRACRLRPDEANVVVDAVGVGLDLTARDLQSAAKKKGEPWAVSKGFDGAAPLSALCPIDDLAVLADVALSLDVNGERRQSGRTSAMLWSVAELLVDISRKMTLEPGDLVFTGTPAGVGPLRSGDRAVALLGTLARLEIAVAS